MEEPVEMIEIWMSVEKDGEAYHVGMKKNLKCIILIANGTPIRIEKDFFVEKKYMNKKDVEALKANLNL